MHYNPCPRRYPFLSRGLTLSELLIATIIVTVVLMGLGVASLAIRKMDAGYVRDTTLYMNLAVIGEDIRYAARKAVGTQSDPGIFVDSSVYNMCFRVPIKDPLEPSDPPPSVAHPENLIWRCYSLLAPAATTLVPSPSSTQFYSCKLPVPDRCENPSAVNKNYLGDLDKDVFKGGVYGAPSFSVTGNDHNLRFKLIGRKNPQEGAHLDNNGLLDKGTEDNSQEVIEYTIYPESHSF